MEPPEEFSAMREKIQNGLVSTLRTVNRIAGQDLGFQRNANAAIGDQLDERTAQLLSLSTEVLRSAAQACGLKAASLEDEEDIDLNWTKIVDVADSLLEKAATALDEYTGAIKRKEPPVTEAVGPH
jgi:exosome complex exonuclease RRP6